MRDFILELGDGFCFIGCQHRVALGPNEYFIDLLFCHRFLKALVAVELKIGKFEPEYAGKMDFCLRLGPSGDRLFKLSRKRIRGSLNLSAPRGSARRLRRAAARGHAEAVSASPVMHGVIEDLNAQDIKAVAEYVQSL